MYQIDPFLKTAVFLSIFVFYRLIRAIIQLESDFITLIKRFYSKDKSQVETFTILSRFRLDQNDICREWDFMLFIDSFVSFEEICDNRWHIYSITDRYVYLARVPEGESSCILQNARLSEFLYTNGDKVARINLDDFLQNAANLPPLKSKILFLHSLPSVGGTQTAQLLQAADPSLKMLEVLGEPPVLTSLAVLSETTSIEKMRALTKAALRHALLNFERGQTVIFKARSCCSKIVPYVHSSYPSIQHVFVTTRNTADCIQRIVDNHDASLPVFEAICRLLSHSNVLTDFFFGWRQSEAEAITKIGPTSAAEFALALVMGATIAHQRNLKYFALDAIYYEDLLTDTHTVLRPLMEICEISDLTLHDCISYKRQEEPNLKMFSGAHSLSEEVHERLKYLADLFQQEWNR